MTDANGYYIRRVKSPAGDAYALVDKDGVIVPYQKETSLRSSADEPPAFTVTFRAGKGALRVIDERED